MIKKIFRKVQFLSNIATIVIAVLLSFIVAKQYLFPTPQEVYPVSSVRTVKTSAEPPLQPETKPHNTPIGQIVPLQNVNWKESKKNVVLYLSTTCRFCTESSPFYKQLAEKYSGKNVKIIAVMPQTVEEGKQYLKNLGIDISEVYNAKLVSIGVTGTPTLLLVDESGVVSNMWRGKLSDDAEKEVLSKLPS